jgi:hypothetical protein
MMETDAMAMSTVVLTMRRWAGGLAIVRFHLAPSSRGLDKGKLNLPLQPMYPV